MGTTPITREAAACAWIGDSAWAKGSASDQTHDRSSRGCLLGTGLAAGCATQRSVTETHFTGTAERPGPGDANGGGAAQLVLYPDQGKICFGITVNNITVPATAAHIHRGPLNVAGPVVVALTPPGPDANSASRATGVNHDTSSRQSSTIPLHTT